MAEKHKILIVDDEENIVFSLSLLLKNEGYTVATANNGKEAIEKFSAFQPEIVLLDIMMPILDGFETAKAIRLMDEQSQVSILFLTAKGTSADKIKAYSKGGDDYIIKPFDNASLLEKIKNFLGNY